MRKKVIALTASVASICTSFLFLVQAQSSTVQKITDMESVVNSIEASEKTFSIKKRALQNHGAAYVAESKYYQFVLPESTEQPIQILSEDFDYSMTIPMEQKTDSIVLDNTLYMLDENKQHAITIEANAYGVLQTHIIYGDISPTSFSFCLDLPNGSYVDFTPSVMEDEKAEGSIGIYNSKGRIKSGLLNPVATDANGNVIDASYSINGNEIVLTVDHRNAAINYPVQVSVQAASFGFSDFFSSGRWITRSGIRSLSLTRRTDNGSWESSSGAIGATLIGEMAWETVYNRFHKQSCWYNTNGMHDQFMCHVGWAMFKSPWNLEPSSPDVGYAATVAAGCNP